MSCSKENHLCCRVKISEKSLLTVFADNYNFKQESQNHHLTSCFDDTNFDESSDSDVIDTLCTTQDSKSMINSAIEIATKLVSYVLFITIGTSVKIRRPKPQNTYYYISGC